MYSRRTRVMVGVALLVCVLAMSAVVSAADPPKSGPRRGPPPPKPSVIEQLKQKVLNTASAAKEKILDSTKGIRKTTNNIVTQVSATFKEFTWFGTSVDDMLKSGQFPADKHASIDECKTACAKHQQGHCEELASKEFSCFPPGLFPDDKTCNSGDNCNYVFNQNQVACHTHPKTGLAACGRKNGFDFLKTTSAELFQDLRIAVGRKLEQMERDSATNAQNKKLNALGGGAIFGSPIPPSK
jgi:hypothetical protein